MEYTKLQKMAHEAYESLGGTSLTYDAMRFHSMMARAFHKSNHIKRLKEGCGYEKYDNEFRLFIIREVKAGRVERLDNIEWRYCAG